MVKGQKKEREEKNSERMVKTYGVHLGSRRLPGIIVTLPVFRKAGISQEAICCLVRQVPETGGADLTFSFHLSKYSANPALVPLVLALKH